MDQQLHSKELRMKPLDDFDDRLKKLEERVKKLEDKDAGSASQPRSNPINGRKSGINASGVNQSVTGPGRFQTKVK
jgi:hypothetical protein